MKGGATMKLEITGSAKEIAALVAALQERRESLQIDFPYGHTNDLVVKHDDVSEGVGSYT